MKYMIAVLIQTTGYPFRYCLSSGLYDVHRYIVRSTLYDLHCTIYIVQSW